MTKKDQANAALTALCIVGSIVLFAMGQIEAGSVLIAFAGGHVLPSPLRKSLPPSEPEP